MAAITCHNLIQSNLSKEKGCTHSQALVVIFKPSI